MSENLPTAPEPLSDGLSGDSGTSGTPEPQNGSQDSRPNREARYRVERNEAREALAAAEARISDLQTRELHRLAGELLAQPEDIGLSGLELKDFLSPEGWLDAEAVAEAAADVIEGRPGLAKNPRQLAVDPTQGQGGGPVKPQISWGDLLKS